MAPIIKNQRHSHTYSRGTVARDVKCSLNRGTTITQERTPSRRWPNTKRTNKQSRQIYQQRFKAGKSPHFLRFESVYLLLKKHNCSDGTSHANVERKRLFFFLVLLLFCPLQFTVWGLSVTFATHIERRLFFLVRALLCVLFDAASAPVVLELCALPKASGVDTYDRYTLAAECRHCFVDVGDARAGHSGAWCPSARSSKRQKALWR